ncbi:unnamed protein product, partial [Hapterophycus canaliculatus]
QVRYDVRRGFFVQGLFEVELRGLHDVMAVVDEGNGNRRVSSHLLNKDSSRSHSLLTVYLDSERKDPEDGHLVKQFGKVSPYSSRCCCSSCVSFVDLAGSERLKKSNAANEKETGAINKSLMTLGKVISALSKRSAVAAAAAAAAAAEAQSGPPVLVEAGMAAIEALSLPATDANPENNNNNNNNNDTDSRSGTDSRKRHSSTTGAVAAAVTVDPSASTASSDIWVPYRDSTLTKLLMDSLGGNGLTLMVACVSPSTRHAEESAGTLNYAARARNIRNRPLVRIDARERLINALRREINLLREENELLRMNKLRDEGQGQPLIGTYSGGVVETLGELRDGGLFAPALLPQAGFGSIDGGSVERGKGSGEEPVGGKSVFKQQEPAVLQIGQASRDVAVLLRKYEEECHRLRNEAAQAQQKEQEIGKQTRQALMENDALSRTVERLQKSFAAEKASNKQSFPRSAGFQIRTAAGEQREANLPLGSEGGAPEQQSPTPSTAIGEEKQQHDEMPGGVLETETAAVGAGAVREEVKHLRRVNESLVERVEFFERGQLKAKVSLGGGGGGGGVGRRVQQGSGSGTRVGGGGRG